MKKLSILLELSYSVLLCFFFNIYADTKLEYSDAEAHTALFASLLLIILFTEWYRRYSLKDSRVKYEKYFFIPAMFLALLFGMYFVDSLTY